MQQSLCEADPNRLCFASLSLHWQLVPGGSLRPVTHVFHIYSHMVMTVLTIWSSVDPIWQYCFLLLKGEQMCDMNSVPQGSLFRVRNVQCQHRGDVLAQTSELTWHWQQSRQGQLCHKGHVPLCDITGLISGPQKQTDFQMKMDLYFFTIISNMTLFFIEKRHFCSCEPEFCTENIEIIRI